MAFGSGHLNLEAGFNPASSHSKNKFSLARSAGFNSQRLKSLLRTLQNFKFDWLLLGFLRKSKLGRCFLTKKDLHPSRGGGSFLNLEILAGNAIAENRASKGSRMNFQNGS